MREGGLGGLKEKKEEQTTNSHQAQNNNRKEYAHLTHRSAHTAQCKFMQ